MLKRIFLFFSVFFILFPAHTDAIDEIVVSGDWRDTNLSEVDSSLIPVSYTHMTLPTIELVEW